MVNAKNTTLLITGTSHGLVHLLMLALPYITAKLLEVTAVPATQDWLVVVLLNTPAYFVFGFGALPAGILCDKYGPTKTIALGFSLSVISSLGLFFLWPLGLLSITLFFVLYSFGAGLYHPAGTAWVSRTFVENRGKALGRHGIGGSIGQASSPIISAIILSTIYWPIIFLFLACTAAIVAFICLKVRFEETELEESTLEKSTLGSGLFSSMTVITLGLLSMVSVARGMHYRGTVTALPIYLTSELTAFLVIAGLLGTFVYLAGAMGQEVGGRLTDTMGWKKTLITMSFLSSLSLILLSIPYTATLFNDAILLSAILLFGFSNFSAQAATNTMVASLSSPNTRGTIFGVSFFTRFGLGALGIPLVGFCRLYFGTWTIGFLVLAILILLSTAIIPFINPRTENK
ncbi:MAG: MFS transporter [Promethearchaeota archaeon]